VGSAGGLQQLAGAAAAVKGRRGDLPADSQVIVDPAEAARQSALRRRHINVVTYPVARAVGFQLLILVLLGHSVLVRKQVDWTPLLAYMAVAEVYCAVSWWALARWFDRVKAFDLGLLFLNTDIVLWAGGVYVSGGHTSWLFFILALRVADQSFVNFRRAAAFAHLAPFWYLAMLVYQDRVDQVSVDWSSALAQTLLLYLSSLYLLMSGRNAEALRNRSAAAVRLARDSIAQLQERSRQLARAKEEAEAASVAKSQFLANMSHELKTPLNAVIGYSEMLMEDPDADEESRRADLLRIRTAGQHLLALINEVLELARLEAGRTDVRLEEIDVPTLVQEAALGLSSAAQKNGNILDVRCSPAVGPMLTDPAKLRRILLTLLGNGLKFTEKGQVRLDVELTADGTGLLFRVSDTGIGMNDAQLSRLFQPFMQADGSTTRKHGGAALGLTLTKRYCEMLGGSLAVESTPGAGTVFTALLPVATALPAAQEAGSEAPA
jgi:signal transduction histidine kinase